MFHYIDYSIDYSIQFLFLCFAGCIIVSQNLRGRVAKIENKWTQFQLASENALKQSSRNFQNSEYPEIIANHYVHESKLGQWQAQLYAKQEAWLAGIDGPANIKGVGWQGWTIGLPRIS